MNIAEYKKVNEVLKRVYAELEKEALEHKINLISDEYYAITRRAREEVLKNMGFTPEDYDTINERLASTSKEGMIAMIDETQRSVEKLTRDRTFSRDEIEAIARNVAQEFVKPPQIINQIVKETTVEKPTTIEKTINTIERVEYDDTPIRNEIVQLKSKVEEIKPIEVNVPEIILKVREEFSKAFGELFKQNIDVLGMPDFRKLGMGLQGQIDAIKNPGLLSIFSSSSHISWNTTNGAIATHTATENTTLDNPANLIPGGTYILVWKQHASSPKTLAFGSAFKWPSGTAPTVTATNSATDILTFVSDGTNLYGVSQLNFS